jgi:hypothetical protein
VGQLRETKREKDETVSQQFYCTNEHVDYSSGSKTEKTHNNDINAVHHRYKTMERGTAVALRPAQQARSAHVQINRNARGRITFFRSPRNDEAFVGRATAARGKGDLTGKIRGLFASCWIRRKEGTHTSLSFYYLHFSPLHFLLFFIHLFSSSLMFK